jgi:Holliday junction resolvasome RuvABC endonuclease subunit
MNVRVPHNFVLALYPNSRGIAFVVFEGAQSLVDWGIRVTRHKNEQHRCLSALADLFVLYQPAMLILENMASVRARRSRRIRSLNAEIAERALQLHMPVHFYSRDQVRQAFVPFGASTKEAIANEIAEQVPALARLVPPPRKPWTSEHARMGVFDAAALALTFFGSTKM